MVAADPPGTALGHRARAGDPRLTRVAAVADLLYLGGWYAPIAGAVIGVWNAVTVARWGNGGAVKVRTVVVALAFIGIFWIAAQGGLMSLDLNY